MLISLVLPDEGDFPLGFELGGPIALLVLVFDVYAILQTARSNAGSVPRVLWIVFILVAPIIGFLFWLFLGPREQRSLFR
ncbi:PLD nuclease N-terminal domain-containing protein [Hyphobacterium sp. HN65]|uniref:PLD nuclease N-terminal domain-containing protein n=1 Tax=Hyphobacterium lacteum TaxID=3116575 RepID=A0ABU7LPJ7_9PROT|nr:PLD nuclease N-terminal domain-containing protein [Hyphobacterium sp. HN65]MEE2525822.1 PLD nuclease N-terminal domain-containing protein [Hyphobacterium sp. HN65]